MKKSPLKLSNAILWFLLIAAPLPYLVFLFNFIFGIQKLQQLEEKVEKLHAKTALAQEIQRKESLLLASLKNPDPHYLDKNVESLTFLLPEIKKLEAIQSENPDEEQIGGRLQFLKEGSNRLTFAEEQIRTNEIFREIEEQQQHPVEMNEEDLKKLLCLIEGITIWPYGPKEGRPQLIIKDFKLSKKEISSQEKAFVVSMQLIKRENLESSR
jgi:hypothetical protein